MLVALSGPLSAERPPAPRLLPESTIFFVSAPNVRELETRFFNTNFGRMVQDPHFKPLIDRLRGDLAKAIAEAKDHIGVSLDEMLEMYQGEITFAIVDIKMVEVKIPNTEHTFRAPQPVMTMLFEAGDKMPLVRRLLGRS
jgi:hypothetical protein